MSFAAIAALLSGQRPFFIYAFRKAGAEFLYTSLPTTLTKVVAGVTGSVWSAAAISHARIPFSSESYRSEFPITLPLSDEFARGFLAPVGIEGATVTIWKGFQNDPDAELVVQYKGGVLGAKPREGGTIVLTCMSDLSGLRRKGLTAVMQRPCRHALYHLGCGVSLASRRVDAAVTALTVDALTLTVPIAASSADGFFNGGIFEYGGLSEMILSHVGSTLVLAAPFPNLADAYTENGGVLSVTLAPGCDLTRATCEARFDNLDNFGGFPWLTETPFDGRSIV